MVNQVDASQEMKSKLDKIVDYLKALGCSKVLLFGSLVEGRMQKHSDIDIAVYGVSGEAFFKAVASLPFLIKHNVHLVDSDLLPSGHRHTIESNGVVLYAN
jgi:predicted nucleotidyltransferase